jgi:DNA-binding CsgD family transcriptional regulator
MRQATLIERDSALSSLAGWLQEARGGHGRVVLLSGEAGVGKTALVAAFLAVLETGVRILSGACDGLFTPEPLAPLFDIADQAGGLLLAAAAAARPRRELFASFLAEISRERPTVVVLEDLHWADEATLDLLRFVARRLDTSPVLLIATYRDDELGPDHPLGMLLGGLAGVETVRRLQLAPLSEDGLRLLAAGSEVDATELYRLTGGNPFFATELLDVAEGEVPETVRDAVLARVSRLSSDARDVLEAASVIGTRVDSELLETVVQGSHESVAECVAGGLLRFDGDTVCFRHELARIAVEQALTPGSRRDLNRRMLAALLGHPGERDAAALAHHAEVAGDRAACFEYSVAAAERASALGAHREAAAQYERALRFAAAVDERTSLSLHERLADECYLTGNVRAALELRRHTFDGYRRLGDRLREGEQLRALSVLLFILGRGRESVESAQEALHVLQTLPACPELALAYADVAASRASLELDLVDALELADRALSVADTVGGSDELHAYVLGGAGYVDAIAGRGTVRCELSLNLSLERKYHDLASRSYMSLALSAGLRDDLVTADRWLDAGIRYAEEHDLDTHRLVVLGWRAWSLLGQCRFDDAADVASPLTDPALPQIIRAVPLVVIGLVRARRGDPEPWAPLDDALPFFATSTMGALVRSARAEAAVLAGDLEAARIEALAIDPHRFACSAETGALLVWAHRAGAAPATDRDLPDRFSLELAGEHAAAAASWEERGARYQAIMARAFSEDEALLRQAHAQLAEFGAHAAARMVGRRLRERGATGIARGPRSATRENTAGLTPRELEVVQLLAEGLRSTDIAARLFVSPRTVDRHLSSIFRKLNVRTRTEAAAEAAKLGLTQDG